MRSFSTPGAISCAFFTSANVDLVVSATLLSSGEVIEGVLRLESALRLELEDLREVTERGGEGPRRIGGGVEDKLRRDADALVGFRKEGVRLLIGLPFELTWNRFVPDLYASGIAGTGGVDSDF